MSDLSPLVPNRRDHLVSALKGVLGLVPLGSLVGEVLTVVIPEQRVDRIGRFVAALDARVAALEPRVVEQALKSEPNTELLEEGVRQSSRALSDDRISYLAQLVATGLDPGQSQQIDARHLLQLLGELNDLEVLWLRYYLVPTAGGDNEFRERNASLFDLPSRFDPSEAARDKLAIHTSYLEHLCRLNLLAHRYQRDPEVGFPEFDGSGAPKVSGYSITTLGELLLRTIGFTAPPAFGAQQRR